MRTNYLARVFDFTGDTIDSAGPSIFKFLAVVLPYLTPLPVAMLTANSVSRLLGFTPFMSGVFVFALEGIGVLFTSLWVEAIHDALKHRAGYTMATIFSIVLIIYLTILVILNVVLHNDADSSSQLKVVITLICFLPLLSSVGASYYRIKRSETVEALRREAAQHELQIQDEQRALELEQQRKNHEFQLEQQGRDNEHRRRLERLDHKRAAQTSSNQTTGDDSADSSSSEVREQMKRTTRDNSPRGRALASIDKFASKNGRAPTRKELVELGHDKSTAFRALEQWRQAHPGSS